jgi:hypothetical protein
MESALFTFGTKKHIYIDEETGDALFATLTKCAGVGDIRVVIITGAGPGRCVHYYSMPALIGFAESVRPLWRECSGVPVSKGLSTPVTVNRLRVGLTARCKQDGQRVWTKLKGGFPCR